MLADLIAQLNGLFPLYLAAGFVFDCFLEGDVFEENSMNHRAVVLVWASLLRNIARFISQENWQIDDLTTPGGESRSKMSLKICLDRKDCCCISHGQATIILQVYDNIVMDKR